MHQAGGKRTKRDQLFPVQRLHLVSLQALGHVCLRNLLPADVLPLVVPEVLAVLSQRFAAAA